MHNLCIFDFFVQKSLLTKNYFLIVEINLTTRGPLYTCLVFCAVTRMTCQIILEELPLSYWKLGVRKSDSLTSEKLLGILTIKAITLKFITISMNFFVSILSYLSYQKEVPPAYYTHRNELPNFVAV